MARPVKQGLDYFSFDTDFFSSSTFTLIERTQKADGILVAIRLMCEIYKKGYYMHLTEDDIEAHAIILNVKPAFVKETIDLLCKWNFFDRSSLKEHGILTSKNFQNRYFEAVQRRSKVEVITEYLLIDVGQFKNRESMNISSISAQNKVETKTQQEQPPEKVEKQSSIPKSRGSKDDEVQKELMSFFGFNEMNNFDKLKEITSFINVLSYSDKLEYFKKMFAAYKEFKKISKQQKHSFKGFIGDVDEEYNNGGWNAENWEAKLKNENGYGKTKGNNTKGTNPVHAGIGGHDEESL